MSDYVPIPKRNVWRSLFDIRPAGMTLEPQGEELPYLDLRVMRRARFATARAKAVVHESPTHVFAPFLKRMAVFASSIAILAGVFWAGSAGRSYIESRKTDIVATASGIIAAAERGTDLMAEMRFEEAGTEFRAAAADLKNFEKTMRPAFLAVSLSARVLPENDYVKTVAMLRDARAVFGAAADLNDAIAELAETAPNAIFSGGGGSFALLASMRKALTALVSAVENMESNRNTLSDSIAGEWFGRLPETKLALAQAERSLGFFEKFLGQSAPFTILFLFQNPAEIRATGGFVGSYGILRMERGGISEFRVDDIYNPDGQREEQGLPAFLPPRPLQRVTGVWEARDANWFFDFGLSAKKAAAFIAQIAGTEFDLVVAINPRPVAELIDLVGAIEMPEYEKTITGDNFWEETQFQTRAGEDRKINQPKRFLTILGPRLLEKFRNLDAADLPEFSRILSDGLSKKDLLMWSPDSDLQSLIASRGWDGKVAEIQPDDDYLAVVLSNIGGAKADYVMKQNYDLKTTIEPSGTITNTLIITRAHEGDRAPHPWWKARNVTYIRVFVPKGSALLDITGAAPEPKLLELDRTAGYGLDPDVTMTIGAAVRLAGKNAEVFEEAGRTVFGFWHTIDPGQTKTITVKWQLPFKADFAPPRYTLFFQKQSGVDGVFRHGIELPRGSSVLSVEPLGAGANRAAIGDKFSWIAEPMDADIRHALSYQLR